MLRPLDVLFNRTNTIELVGKTAIYLGEQPAIFAGYLIRINVDPSLLDARYVNFILNTEAARKYSSMVLSVAVGQANINGQKLKTYPIPLPPTLAEQEAIAGALSDADAWIESLEQLIAKKRKIKQGAMQELLTGKRRLPEFKSSWETKTLGDIGEAVAGLTYAPTDVAETGTLVLRASNVAESTLVFRDNVYVKMDLPDRVFVKEGDILICVRNGSRDLIGKCAKIDSRSASVGHVFGAFMCVYRTEHHGFVFHQFQSENLEHLASLGSCFERRDRIPQRMIAVTGTKVTAEELLQR